MSKRKSPKTSTPAPKANGLKLARELMGLILLFFGLYLLLSLVTFDVRDPGFNHAISTAKGVHNSAGVIGSYLGGMLTDIFGVAAYIWPVFTLVLALRQLFFRFSVQWWRCLGFVCLLLCFMMASTAWKFQLGDIVGGGFIGDAIYGITWKFLSGTGSLLLGLCFFLISLQLMFNISWLALVRAFCLWIMSCWNDMRVGSSESDGDEPDDPTSPDEKSKKQESKAKITEKKQIIVDVPNKVKSASADEELCVDSAIEAESSPIENTAKTSMWSRIKNAFLQATQKQTLPLNTVQDGVPAQNIEDKELAIEVAGVRPAPTSTADNAAHPVAHVQNTVDLEQGSGTRNSQEPITFLQENSNTCPNPFAAPWARACDIQAEWAQPVEPVSKGHSEHATNFVDSFASDQSELSCEVNKSDTALVGPNGGLLVARDIRDMDVPQSTQDDTEQDEFVFDNFSENTHENSMQQSDIVENQKENAADFEIDLDASMAVLANTEANSSSEFLSDASLVSEHGDNNDAKDGIDEFTFDNVDDVIEQNKQSNRDAIAETLRDLQTILDVQPAEQSDVYLGAKATEPFATRSADGISGLDDFVMDAQDDAFLNKPVVNNWETSTVPSEQKKCDMLTSCDGVDPCNTANGTGVTDFVESSMPEDDIPPSFEVLMDADKDGITDLTEEEVGTGGAAKAAPVKIKTRLPHLDLLQDAVDDEYSKPRLDILTEKGERLTKCLADFGIQGELTRITPGPVVTMFEFRPAPGVKVSRIANLSDDLALALKAIAVRIQAPIPGTDTVGIEIPNEVRETIYFKDLLASETFHDASSLLTLAVGKDSAGRPSVADLAKMPHLLVAGATGAGKSVCLNSILLSFLYKARPEDVQLLLIDPKRIELAVYSDLPHLVHPVVTDMSHAKNALEWAVHEMEKRYEGMQRLAVRNIAGYNQKLEAFGNDKPIEYLDLEFMPYLVIIIDELADLMLTAAKEVETSIVRLAQLARAAGIHMVLATQRPSVDVVTGLIKANFPCRISFQVTSKHDSRTILDTVGAEHLLGRGDMLFKPSGGRLQRLHGAFVSDDEVANVVEFWKRQQAPMYRVDFAQWGSDATQEGLEGGAGALADDPIYNDAVEFVLGQGQASISLIQRRFRIGFNKAARYVEQMEIDGFVGPANGSKPRPVIKGHEI